MRRDEQYWEQRRRAILNNPNLQSKYAAQRKADLLDNLAREKAAWEALTPSDHLRRRVKSALKVVGTLLGIGLLIGGYYFVTVPVANEPGDSDCERAANYRADHLDADGHLSPLDRLRVWAGENGCSYDDNPEP